MSLTRREVLALGSAALGGATLHPSLLGRLLAAEMPGAPPHEILGPFRPARFS